MRAATKMNPDGSGTVEVCPKCRGPGRGINGICSVCKGSGYPVWSIEHASHPLTTGGS